jgi:hypothetical protein
VARPAGASSVRERSDPAMMRTLTSIPHGTPRG